jgi:hypothetical protein
VRQVVRANQGAVQDCYDRSTLDGRPLHGKVKVVLEVSGTGEVTQVAGSSTILERGAPLERCIVEAARTWRFPPPGDGAPTQVSHTFKFE